MSNKEAAERACQEPNPIIDGRKANVNLAILGAKPRGNLTGNQVLGIQIYKYTNTNIQIHKYKYTTSVLAMKNMTPTQCVCVSGGGDLVCQRLLKDHFSTFPL